MEIQYIDTEVFRKIMERFNKLVEHIDLVYDKTKGKQLGEWMDNQDVCLYLNISPRTLQTLRDNGKLPYTQIQHKIFYKVADVESLVSYVGLKRKEKILRDKNNLNK